jgi:hypothetical protein
MPIPPGYASAATKKKVAAPRPAITHSGDGSSAVCATSTIAAAGSTIRFGMMKRSMSIADTTTSTAQKNAATAASSVSPKTRKQATISPAVTSSTTG